jgi:ATP-dependent RNA helicase DDX35
MSFWKPGTIAPGSDIEATQLDRETEKEANVVVYNKHENLSINAQRARLPIFQNKIHILYLLENYPTVIIVGSTGCGKTTQIPQYLHENGWTVGGRCIACTQPRRVAATSVAARVAYEMGVKLGEEVGYSVRFDDCSDPEKTRIKYLTDGMLLREMMLDPLLTKYSVVMLDEAHERSLYTDILIGLIKKVQKKRRDLRVIVSSATVDAEEFKEFFTTSNNWVNPSLKENVAILSIEGRQYPVDIYYTSSPVSDYLQAALNTVFEIHLKEPPGDILVFLTGQEEIESLVKKIKEKNAMYQNRELGLKVLPLYAGLSMEQQLKPFRPAPPKTRKVIVATNIAETSVTIDGIVYVIDCGFVKIRAYNPKTGMESLVVVPCSQSSCNQRAGRAGRVKAGKCFRLFTEESFHSLPPKPIPEMQRSNLAMVVLQLKAMGIDNVLYFDFMSPPPAEAMIRALELLYALGALDDSAKLTSTFGVKMAEFPTDPQMSKMLLSSGEFGCSEEILTIAAMLSIQSAWVFPKGTTTYRIEFFWC